VPKPEDARSIQAQADNEAAYRQLLVQGVLALLLPTEDLENECLTSLVGQIFSELIIGNQVANKISEPWLILEILIILTRLVNRQRTAGTSEHDGSTEANPHDALRGRDSIKVKAARSPRGWSIDQIFWSLVQWGFLAVTSIRLLITTIVLSPSLPPRSTPILVRRRESTGHYDSEKSYNPPAGFEAQSPPVKVPIIDFNLWPCIANLLETDARMPWLAGVLSMVQWGAMRGPGRVAGYNGIIDR
jgi:splicing suppressor protein 51